MICKVELGELENHHEDFARRNVRVVVVSPDDQTASSMTQKELPHLVVLSDQDQNLAKAIDVVAKGMAPDGGDTNVPTTFLIDGTGKVRWFFRPDSYIIRLPAKDLLAAVDANLGKS
jgi:peroxiredoxin